MESRHFTVGIPRIQSLDRISGELLKKETIRKKRRNKIDIGQKALCGHQRNNKTGWGRLTKQ